MCLWGKIRYLEVIQAKILTRQLGVSIEKYWSIPLHFLFYKKGHREYNNTYSPELLLRINRNDEWKNTWYTELPILGGSYYYFSYLPSPSLLLFCFSSLLYFLP